MGHRLSTQSAVRCIGYGAIALGSTPNQEVYEKITFIKPAGKAPPFQGGWGPNPPFNQNNLKWIVLNGDGTIGDVKSQIAANVTAPIGEVFWEYEQEIGIGSFDFCGNWTIKSVTTFTYSAYSTAEGTWGYIIDQGELEEN